MKAQPKPSPFGGKSSEKLAILPEAAFEETVRSLQVGHKTLQETDGSKDWEGINDQIQTIRINQPVDGRRYASQLTEAERQEKLLELAIGRLTPGEVFDLSLEQQVRSLNERYLNVNFGMEINNDTFDFFLPRRIDKEKHKVLYR